MRTNHILFLGLSLALAACSPFSPDLGSNPFQCEPTSMKCPSGYLCQDDGTGTRMVCIQEGGTVVDAPPNGFQCADDSNIETQNGANNDAYTSAYSTGINGSTRKMIDFAGLAICPEGDKDTYQFTSTTVQNLEVVISWTSGLPLSGSILGSGGQKLADATANGDKSVRAYIAMAPAGAVYYAQVFGGATTKNNYSMTITVSP